MNKDLFRKVDKETRSTASRYQGLGFKRNPFPRHPGVVMNDPDDRQNGSIYLRELRSEEESQFERILIPTDKRPETKSIAFLMDYATRKGRGIGKTAFLNYQRNRVMRDLGKALSNETEVLFAVYVAPIPNDNYRKFWGVSRLIIESLIDQDIISIAICRIRVFTGLIHEEILEKVGDDLIATIGNDEWLLKEFNELKSKNKSVKEFDINALNQGVKRKLIKLGLDNELSSRLARFGCVNSDLHTFYFDKQPDFFWKRNANNVLFTDLVKVFDEAGFTHGLILFEELEKVIVPQTSSSRRDFCESLRYYFIDGESAENTKLSFYKVLLTIHPYLQELLNPHWNASGLGRFAGLSEETSHDFTVFFNPIEAPSAVPLATAYLNESRPEEYDKKAPLSPFTKGALEEALLKTLGVPGKYLAFLHSAIEHAVDKGWAKIDTANIKELALADTLPDDDDEDEQLPDAQVKMK